MKDLGIRLIIFDLDGVLVHPPFDHFIDARRRVVKILEEYGIQITTDSPFFKKVYDAIMNTFKENAFAKALYKYMSKIVEKYELKALNKAKFSDNVGELLEKLRSLNYKIAIFSQGGEKYVKTCIEKLGIRDMIDFFLTRDDDIKPKPYPDGILKICEELSVNNNETIFVGDTLIDVETAKNANVVPIIITRDGKKKQIQNAYYLKELNVKELINLIKKIEELKESTTS